MLGVKRFRLANRQSLSSVLPMAVCSYQDEPIATIKSQLICYIIVHVYMYTCIYYGCVEKSTVQKSHLTIPIEDSHKIYQFGGVFASGESYGDNDKENEDR